MPKSRVPSPERKARSAPEIKGGAVLRYLGLSLSGGKSDKSCLAVLEVYSSHQRVFLSRLHEKIRSEDLLSADHKIVGLIEELESEAKVVAFDAPLSLPRCLICPIACDGYETCPDPEVAWMREQESALPKKKTRKMFTPYTQRAVDMHLAAVETENMEVQHALGANLAPLTARAQYLQRRIQLPSLEVFPRLAVWRMGLEMKVNKTSLRNYRHAVGGEEARRAFLSAWVEKAGLFLYQQDLRMLCENLHAFDALICAWVAYLKDQGRTEARPKDFPETAAWVEYPKRVSLA